MTDEQTVFHKEPCLELVLCFSSLGISDEMTWYLKANWVIFNIANSSAVVVTLTYWGLVYNGKGSCKKKQQTKNKKNTLTRNPVQFRYPFFGKIICNSFVPQI